MKKRIVPVAVALALTASTGIAAASWCQKKGADPSDTAGERGDLRGHRLDRWATVLKLTDDQEAQVEGIFEAERPVMTRQFQTLKEARRDLRTAAESGTFDENAVRALAQKKAQAQTELTVERARVRSKLLAVLTPDQQNLLKSLQPLVREGGRRRGGAEFGAEL
ncbi:MAG: Spy/CpxP family protein refolding chaperone [Deltaproteobacteria bacterium]|nr:Spy/CpxP family protein refolding chaperone [Deltaproteobacteria bacterium]